MTDFKLYLKLTGQTLTSFSQKLGISDNYLSLMASGSRPMKCQMAYDIEVLTGGFIPMSYWANKDRPHLADGVVKCRRPKPTTNKG